MKYDYPAISLRQTSSDKRTVLFAAQAAHISIWAGIPQKKAFGADAESVGFQRDENEKRLREIAEFCSNPSNIIQNPLLCATRDLPFASTKFTAFEDSDEAYQLGTLTIEVPDYGSWNITELLRYVREYIEMRVPDLKNADLNSALIATLKKQASLEGPQSHEAPDAAEAGGLADDPINLEPPESETYEPVGVLFEESHIVDFWNEVACRHEVAKLMDSPPTGTEFLGFTTESLLSYVRPVVLVDGQHRLRGALRAMQDCLSQSEIQTEIEKRISEGESEESVRISLNERLSRVLPISLLLSPDPSEQVFQFIVVNQKATPIGRALLGTIVSTTLSNDEMASVAIRLKEAGIALEESQAITFLARSQDSPFYGLIERGLAGDSKTLLQWGVFASLIGIFRDLRGGKLYGYNNDYANVWRNKFLESCASVSQGTMEGYENSYDYWRSLNGPWRDVFIQFFSRIRDFFGNTTDTDSHNYWGDPRNSNLFNKVSLTILAADFFQFLVERKMTIDSAASVKALVDEWLEDVNPTYFNRDWNLSGVKKDSTGIRNQWAYQWEQYRKNPSQLPQARMFRVAKAA